MKTWRGLIRLFRQGNAEAALPAGINGRTRKGGVPQDYKRAADFIPHGGGCRDSSGESRAGRFIIADGNGVPQDYEKAVFWLNRAAEQGYVEARGNWPIFMLINVAIRLKHMPGWLSVCRPWFPNTPDLVQVSPDLERLLRSMTRSR